MVGEATTTYNALLAQLSSFLTISIHSITHARRCYPPSSFLTARAYNYPVAQSRHPKVCEWINSAVDAVITEVRKGAVARVAVVIAHPETHQPLERFLWDLSRLPFVPRADADAPLVRDCDTTQRPTEKEDVDLSEQLRATLATLSVCGTRLRPVPEGCTFTVAIELKGDSAAITPIGHPQPWVPAEPNLQRRRGSPVPVANDKDGSGSGEDGEKSNRSRARQGDLGGVRTLPMRAVEAGEMNFEMWIEEGRAKNESSLRPSQETLSSANGSSV